MWEIIKYKASSMCVNSDIQSKILNVELRKTDLLLLKLFTGLDFKGYNLLGIVSSFI